LAGGFGLGGKAHYLPQIRSALRVWLAAAEPAYRAIDLVHSAHESQNFVVW